MKKNLLLGFLLVSSIAVFATTTTVTPETYVTVYSSAADGDILLLDAGTYSTELDFPVGKTITLKKLPEAATTPILTFIWTNIVVSTAGSSLILDGLEITPNADYYIQFATSSLVDKLIIKNCIIGNVNRCLVRATNVGIIMNELTIDNCIFKDCGAKGYAFNWFRTILYNMTIKNSTIYNYGGEGFFLAQNNPQTHPFSFNMQNNTIYQSGKDGSGDYSWCSILVSYDPTSTYNISNNIFNKPYTTADARMTIVVPEGSGTVTCSNNLVVDYPNFTLPPASGWVLSNTFESTINYFADTTNRDFTLASNFPYKGTDNNYLGAPRWWPQSVSVRNINELQVKISANNGMINIESSDVIGSVELYNTKGNKLFAKKMNATQTLINADNLSKGIYLLTIRSKNKIVTKKIVL